MQEIEYLTVTQVAAILKISTDTVIRKFGDQPGVIDLGAPEKQHKRRYRVLRIPRYVLDRVINQNLWRGRGRIDRRKTSATCGGSRILRAYPKPMN